MRCAVLVAAAVGLAIGVLAETSRADPPGSPSKYKWQPLRLEKWGEGTYSLVRAGRGRMARGDCRGALDAFDAALRYTQDPTVVRDRGICNEKLGYPYPAIDDYRSYLTQRPDAPDAEAIRERLDRLKENTDEDDDKPPEAPSVASGAGGSKEAKYAGGSGGDDSSPEDPNRDKLAFESRDEAVGNSPLRAGKGVMLYPFFSEHKFLGIDSGPNPSGWPGGTSFGDSSTWSESVGLGFRYAFDATGSLVVEAGYERFNFTDENLVDAGGLTSLVAYEFRFPMDPAYRSQLFLAPGIGYEHRSVQSSDPSVPSETDGAFLPRVRFGYRRVFGHATALDVSFDAGATKPIEYAGPSGLDEPVLVLLAANVAFVWGF